jgi:hypothetical protein
MRHGLAPVNSPKLNYCGPALAGLVRARAPLCCLLCLCGKILRLSFSSIKLLAVLRPGAARGGIPSSGSRGPAGSLHFYHRFTTTEIQKCMLHIMQRGVLGAKMPRKTVFLPPAGPPEPASGIYFCHCRSFEKGSTYYPGYRPVRGKAYGLPSTMD